MLTVPALQFQYIGPAAVANWLSVHWQVDGASALCIGDFNDVHVGRAESFKGAPFLVKGSGCELIHTALLPVQRVSCIEYSHLADPMSMPMV